MAMQMCSTLLDDVIGGLVMSFSGGSPASHLSSFHLANPSQLISFISFHLISDTFSPHFWSNFLSHPFVHSYPCLKFLLHFLQISASFLIHFPHFFIQRGFKTLISYTYFCIISPFFSTCSLHIFSQLFSIFLQFSKSFHSSSFLGRSLGASHDVVTPGDGEPPGTPMWSSRAAAAGWRRSITGLQATNRRNESTNRFRITFSSWKICITFFPLLSFSFTFLKNLLFFLFSLDPECFHLRS